MKYFVLFLTLLFSLHPAFGQKAEVRETEHKMSTYGFHDPNPVPIPSNAYYPYFRFDGFSIDKVDQNWKVIELENDYIKVNIFPEIGGKVWGAIDKVNNKEFIYNNNVVKFRDIAMRGPWVSGGIEFNFGIIGHAPTSATPVDYFTTVKPDGSVSCYISSFEFITRTTWTVEINLPKDKAYFSTKTTWFNNSSIDQPYYQWMNAGYKALGNAELCYPGTNLISHGGDLYSFPIDEKGRDISWYNNLDFGGSKSYHVLGKYNDFYGIFWHDDNHGSIHHSDYDEKLGMKIFTWSLARQGSIWEDLLTDNDGQYIELQSGRMYNQPGTVSAKTPFKHTAFQPGQTDSWNEYWYPVADTKGIVKASRIGALNVKREKEFLELYFSPLSDLSTSIQIYVDNEQVKAETVDFKTLQVWKKSLPLTPSITNGKLKIVIGDNDLVYSEAEEDNIMNRPMIAPSDFDWNSAYGLYLSGEQLMNQHIYDKAEEDLKNSLSKDQFFLPAITRLASLYYQLGRYNESLDLCRRGLSINAYDGNINYIYGLNNMVLGHFTDAKDGFSVATYDLSMRTAAYAKLAGIFIREKEWKKGIHYAQKSLQFNNENLEALHELLVCYRHTDQLDEFSKLYNELIAILPLDHFTRYEGYKYGNKINTQDSFAALIRNELPEETYMELACWYESIGCFDDAIELLSMVPKYPIAGYHKAYLLHLNGNKAEAIALVKESNELSPEGVFPFRPESTQALAWSHEVSPSWKTAYYQAMLWHHLENKNKAIELLKVEEQSDYMPFYLYRASLKATKDRLDDLKKAESLDKSWRVGQELIKYYMEINAWEDAYNTAKAYYKQYPDNYIIGLQYAKALSETKRYDACISLLSKMTVLPNEGAYTGRGLYRDANLYKAIELLKKKKYRSSIASIHNSKEWKENLGVGKPYDELIDYRLEDFMEAMASDPQKAKELYEKIAKAYDENKGIASTDLLTAIALKKIGKKEVADKWVEKWEKDYPNNPMIQWSVSIYKGENKKHSLETGKTNDEETPWEKTATDYNLNLIYRLFQSIDIVID